jgi:hypothetical protein
VAAEAAGVAAFAALATGFRVVGYTPDELLEEVLSGSTADGEADRLAGVLRDAVSPLLVNSQEGKFGFRWAQQAVMMVRSTEGRTMQKKYIVRLDADERRTLTEVVKRLSGSSQKVRRAQVLLKADADGPAWTDAKIAEAFGCRLRTVETIRERFVTQGFELTLDGAPKKPRPKLLDGRQEAKLIAVRLGPPPKGFANRSLRLLADRVVELSIVGSISHETVRQTLKKTR